MTKLRGEIDKIVELILNWYEENGRPFPWRNKGTDPYRILVAEILLQRTTAKSVERFYPKFIAKYPNLAKLDKARVSGLESILKNLGLLYKAKIFKKIAKKLRENGYEIPDDKKKLMELYGVGDYISSAVLTFGFGINTPIVDSNMRRFAKRFWEINSDKLVKEKLSELTVRNAKEIYFGLLDICWFFCRAPQPQCEECPLWHLCKHID